MLAFFHSSAAKYAKVLFSLSMMTMATAACAQTQAPPADIKPLPFDGALSLARGAVKGATINSFHLSKTDACTIATVDWGWESCEGMDALTYFLVPGADAILFEMPNSDGHVSMEDWAAADKDDTIKSIETDLAAGLAAQGEKLGVPVVFKGWLVYPTLDTEKKVLYYATEATWGAEPNINIKASVFDRQGYVAFTIVTQSNTPTEAEIRAMVDATLAHYQSEPGQDYASFVPGDAVSATGALGVLAALVGVKFGKAAIGGIIAVAILFLKKGGILLLILPFAWLKKRFSRKSVAHAPLAEPAATTDVPPQS
jgi:hypothetical protein